MARISTKTRQVDRGYVKPERWLAVIVLVVLVTAFDSRWRQLQHIQGKLKTQNWLNNASFTQTDLSAVFFSNVVLRRNPIQLS